MRKSILFLAFVALSVACTATPTPPATPVRDSTPESSTPVPIDVGAPVTPSRDVLSADVDPKPCGASELGISEKWIRVLEANNFRKCVRPFGVLIGADSRVPDVYIAQAARIVAEVLDPDMDGIANDLKVAALVADYEAAWIPMPADIDRWDSGGLEQELGATLGSYGLMLPRWWMLGDRNFGDSNPDKHAKTVMVEEIVHFMTQFGYSPAYPEIFGVDDWDSIIAKEAKLASCDWWQHPENDCPGNPGHEGDCSNPSCDVTEFYQQVLVMRAGMEPGWAGIGFPSTADGLEAKLSSALKRVMDDPKYHQINEPLRFSYPDRHQLKS